MNNTEFCHYCGEEYKPKRRGVQKYCSNSCRTGHWNERNKYKTKKDGNEIAKTEDTPSDDANTKIESMSLPGVGNAFVGTAGYDILKSFLTNNLNKPATKKDIEELKTLLFNRYLPINNMEQDTLGRKPFYDIQTSALVYRFP